MCVLIRIRVDFFSFKKLNSFLTLRICTVCVLVWELHFNTLQSISTIRNVTIITKSICKYRIDELRPDNAKTTTKIVHPTLSTTRRIILYIRKNKNFAFSGHMPDLLYAHCSISLAFACNISNKENERKNHVYNLYAYHYIISCGMKLRAHVTRKEPFVYCWKIQEMRFEKKSIHRIKVWIRIRLINQKTFKSILQCSLLE